MPTETLHTDSRSLILHCCHSDRVGGFVAFISLTEVCLHAIEVKFALLKQLAVLFEMITVIRK